MTEFNPRVPMSRRADVKPITYLKSRTADLLREVAEGGHAVTITQNGEARAVLMDVDTYDRWRSAMALLKLLAQGEADVEPGRTVKQSDVFRRARKAIERSASDG
jgi:prevent-host-death family protein